MRRRLTLALLLAVALAVPASALPAIQSTYWLSQVIREPSDWINNRDLAANVAETITAPTASPTTRKVIVTFGGTCLDTGFHYRKSGTAAINAADITNGGGSFRNPVALKMAQGATISVIAPVACQLNEEWHLEDVTQ